MIVVLFFKKKTIWQAQRELQLIIRELRFITTQLRKHEYEDELMADWKFAAMVVDRICLIFFTTFTITAITTVLLSAPHLLVPWAPNSKKKIVTLRYRYHGNLFALTDCCDDLERKWPLLLVRPIRFTAIDQRDVSNND